MIKKIWSSIGTIVVVGIVALLAIYAFFLFCDMSSMWITGVC